MAKHRRHYKLKTLLCEFMSLLTVLSTIIIAVLGWLSLEYYFSLPSEDNNLSEEPESYETVIESHHEYNSIGVGERE